jgi:hypothetical protein
MVGCSTSTRGTPGPDAAADGAADASPVRDARRYADVGRDAVEPRDAGVDSAAPIDAGMDGPILVSALLRLANWSPDAPSIDLCLAPRGTTSWSGPVLAAALGMKASGDLSLVDVGPLDASVDAHPAMDATHEGGDADAALAPEAGAGGVGGVPFPRISPYVAVTPGEYDVRIVAAPSQDCSVPLTPDTDDLPALRAGTTETLALVGDTTVQGTDPGLAVAALEDDTSVPTGRVAIRFVNAVPSVTEVSFVSGSVATGTSAYFLAGQFGSVAVDTDAGTLDPNDYVVLPPIEAASWALLDANGGTVTLAGASGVDVPATELVTVAAVGGESGPGQHEVGILVCADRPPVVAGETSACELYAASAGVCPACR